MALRSFLAAGFPVPTPKCGARVVGEANWTSMSGASDEARIIAADAFRIKRNCTPSAGPPTADHPLLEGAGF
jgi:hypothetical protein